VKEKWGIGVLFLAIAALCYILGQLGFISWVPEYAKSLGMSLNDAGKLVSDFGCLTCWHVGVQLHSALLRFAAHPDRTGGYCHRMMYLFNHGDAATWRGSF
jgi:TsgA-like MFS transporter